MTLRIVFAGTPQAAVPTLEALLGTPQKVLGVLTNPPRRRGRSKALIPSEVGAFAAERELPVLATRTPSDPESLDWLEGLAPDLGVVVAYGSILKPPVLTIPRLGWINLHFSLLPDLRGAAPLQRAIIRGDSEIGCSVFQLESGMDTGPLLSTASYPIGETESAGEALERLSVLGAEQVVETVARLDAGTATAVPQELGKDGQHLSFAPKLEREDGHISFSASPARVINQIRGVTPNPGAWTTLPDGSVLKLGVAAVAPTEDAAAGPVGSIRFESKTVLVRCDSGSVALGQVAPAGKKWMRAADWCRGARLAEGTVLGQTETGK